MVGKRYPVSEKFAQKAHINPQKYQEMYEQNANDPDTFWGEMGKRLDWIKPHTKVKNTIYSYPIVLIKWYEDGTLNVSANCIDRHLPDRRRYYPDLGGR